MAKNNVIGLLQKRIVPALLMISIFWSRLNFPWLSRIFHPPWKSMFFLNFSYYPLEFPIDILNELFFWKSPLKEYKKKRFSPITLFTSWTITPSLNHLWVSNFIQTQTSATRADLTRTSIIHLHFTLIKTVFGIRVFTHMAPWCFSCNVRGTEACCPLRCGIARHEHAFSLTGWSIEYTAAFNWKENGEKINQKIQTMHEKLLINILEFEKKSR